MDSTIINMENYNQQIDLSFSFIKERMKELKIPQYKLAKMIDVSEVTLIRNFKRETEMSFCTYVKICLVLNISLNR